MFKSFLGSYTHAAAAVILCFSASVQAAPIITDGSTISNRNLTYTSQFRDDMLTLSIFADNATGINGKLTSLKSLVFSSLKPGGRANRYFLLDSATMAGASAQDGRACGGATDGGKICFDDLNDSIVAGTPLIYKIDFDYSNGTHLDFDKFNVAAVFGGERRNPKGQLVTFTINESVPLNAMEVPEPASLALLGIGLGMVGFTRRRKAENNRL